MIAVDVKRLQAELNGEVFRRSRDRRRAVVRRYARCRGNGKPILCTPSSWAAIDERERHSDGKVIYDTLALAVAAEREFRQMGAAPQWPYPCPRSRHGHHHLTSRRPPPTQGT